MRVFVVSYMDHVAKIGEKESNYEKNRDVRNIYLRKKERYTTKERDRLNVYDKGYFLYQR